MAIQKENGAIKDDFCVQKSPRNYLPSLCNCLRLNWSFQLLHLGYNLHDKQQGRHSLPHAFTSRSVCPRQRRQPAIYIRLKTETRPLPQTDTTFMSPLFNFILFFKKGAIQTSFFCFHSYFLYNDKFIAKSTKL